MTDHGPDSPIWEWALPDVDCYFCKKPTYSSICKTVSTKPSDRWIHHPVCPVCYERVLGYLNES